MTTTTRTANGPWTTAADWNNGVPAVGDTAVIGAFEADVTAAWTSFATLNVNSNLGIVDFESASLCSITNSVTNSGTIKLDWTAGAGGSTLKSTGASITNNAIVDMGNTTASGDSKLKADGSITNEDIINMYSASSTKDIIDSNNSTSVFQNDGEVNVLGAYGLFNTTVAMGASGVINLDNRGTAEFGKGAAGQITLDGQIDHVILDDSVDFTANIGHFSATGDTVLCKDFVAANTTETYHQNGTHACYISLSDGTHSATINFNNRASWASTDLTFGADANGNVLMTKT